MTKELTVIQNNLAVFDIKEAVLSEFEEAGAWDCKDTNSRKILGKHRANAKSLRSKIEQARLDMNRETLAKNNGAAKAITDRLTYSIEVFDLKIKPFDQVAKDKKAKKDKDEAGRLATIEFKKSNLIATCSAPLGYNIKSCDISEMIAKIEEFIIDDSFQETKPQAEMIKMGGIASAKQALEARKVWEAQQAENERVRLENEAKAKELTEAQEKIEAEKEKSRQEAARIVKEASDKQDKADAEAKAKREAEDELNRMVNAWFDAQRFTFYDCQEMDSVSVYESTIELFNEMVVPEFIGDRKEEAQEKINESVKRLTDLLDELKHRFEDEKKRKEDAKKLAADRQKLEDDKAEIQAEKDRMAAEKDRKAKIELEEAQRVNDVSGHFEMVIKVVGKLIEQYDHTEMRAYDDTLETFEVSNSIFQERADEFKELLVSSRKGLRDAVKFEAIKENTEFEASRIEKLAAHEKRAALVEDDKKILAKSAAKTRGMVDHTIHHDIKTKEVLRILVQMNKEIEAAVNKFEKSLTELV